MIGIYGDRGWFLDLRQHADIGYKLDGFMPETIKKKRKKNKNIGRVYTEVYTLTGQVYA